MKGKEAHRYHILIFLCTKERNKRGKFLVSFLLLAFPFDLALFGRSPCFCVQSLFLCVYINSSFHIRTSTFLLQGLLFFGGGVALVVCVVSVEEESKKLQCTKRYTLEFVLFFFAMSL